MRLSVVIPTYNDHKYLEMCLRALRSQTLPTEEFEVIVVDNGSTESPVIDEAANTRLVLEAQPGSYAARNRGIKESVADVVAFTDADCIPNPSWLASGLAHLDKDPGVACVGGAIEVFPREPSRRTPCEVYESVSGFPQDTYVNDRGFAATANLFVRSEVFDALGSFNASLRSGGDVEFGNRTVDAGYRLIYAGDVVVRHPARRTLRLYLSKLFRTMAGNRDLAAYRRRPFPYPLAGTVRALLPPIPSMVRALRARHVGSLADRFKLAYATLIIHYGRTIFRVRLLLGAESPR